MIVNNSDSEQPFELHVIKRVDADTYDMAGKTATRGSADFEKCNDLIARYTVMRTESYKHYDKFDKLSPPEQERTTAGFQKDAEIDKYQENAVFIIATKKGSDDVVGGGRVLIKPAESADKLLFETDKEFMDDEKNAIRWQNLGIDENARRKLCYAQVGGVATDPQVDNNVLYSLIENGSRKAAIDNKAEFAINCVARRNVAPIYIAVRNECKFIPGPRDEHSEKRPAVWLLIADQSSDIAKEKLNAIAATPEAKALFETYLHESRDDLRDHLRSGKEAGVHQKRLDESRARKSFSDHRDKRGTSPIPSETPRGRPL